MNFYTLTNDTAGFALQIAARDDELFGRLETRDDFTPLGYTGLTQRCGKFFAFDSKGNDTEIFHGCTLTPDAALQAEYDAATIAHVGRHA